MGCASSTPREPDDRRSEYTTRDRSAHSADGRHTPNDVATMAGTEAARIAPASPSEASRSISSISDVPLLFSPGTPDRNAGSVKEFASVKDLMRRWANVEASSFGASWSLMSTPQQPDPLDVVKFDAPTTAKQALEMLIDNGSHKAYENRYFTSHMFFTQADVVVLHATLGMGHSARPCTSAADPSGLGVQNLTAVLDAALTPVVEAIVDCYSEQVRQSELTQLDRRVVQEAEILPRLEQELESLRPNSTASVAPDRADAPVSSAEQYRRAVVLGFKSLIAATGGTSSLAGNLGKTGLPVVPALDRLFIAFRSYLFHPTTGALALPLDDASEAVSQFASVLARIGALPGEEATTSSPLHARRWASDSTLPWVKLYAQSPMVVLSPVARRALVAMELQVSRRCESEPLLPEEEDAEEPRNSTVSFPRLPRHGTLLRALRVLRQARLLPSSMASFTEASRTPAIGFGSKTLLFDAAEAPSQTKIAPAGLMSPGLGGRNPNAFMQPPGSISPGASYSGTNTSPAAVFIATGCRLLASRTGESVDVRKAFEVVCGSRNDMGLVLHLGAPAVEDWEMLFDEGDILEVANVAHYVVEVTRNYTAADDDTLVTSGLFGLVSVDDRIDLIVQLQSIGDNGSDAATDEEDEEADSLPSAPTTGRAPQPVPCPIHEKSLWLRKRAHPILVPGKNECRFNEHLALLPTAGEMGAPGASVTDSMRHITNYTAELQHSFADDQQRKKFLTVMQSFHFLGTLIAVALLTDHPLRLRLPVLLFRVLKAYRPTAAAATGDRAGTVLASFDPTSSSFTASDRRQPSARGSMDVGADDEPEFTCHFSPTLEDLRELGATAAIERAERVRMQSFVEFEEVLDREHLPLDTTKDDYIRDHIIAPAVMPDSLRIAVDASFIAIASSGIHRSVTWQLSSPEELRDMSCNTAPQ